MRPWYRLEFLFRLSKYGKEEKEALDVLHSFTRDIITRKIKKRQEEGLKSGRVADDEVGELWIK